MFFWGCFDNGFLLCWNWLLNSSHYYKRTAILATRPYQFQAIFYSDILTKSVGKREQAGGPTSTRWMNQTHPPPAPTHKTRTQDTPRCAQKTTSKNLWWPMATPSNLHGLPVMTREGRISTFTRIHHMLQMCTKNKTKGAPKGKCSTSHHAKPIKLGTNINAGTPGPSRAGSWTPNDSEKYQKQTETHRKVPRNHLSRKKPWKKGKTKQKEKHPEKNLVKTKRIQETNPAKKL